MKRVLKMKKSIKNLSVFVLTAILLVVSVMPAFAAKDLTVNGVKNIKKGDIVSYDLMLGDCEEEVVGLQMYIKYDKEYLDVVTNSLEFPEIPSMVSNANSDYGIIFNFTNYSSPVDFSTEKVFASVDFKVLKGGKTDITFFVSELYGKDITYLKSYTFTYDLAVNDEVKIDGEPPLITEDEEFINNNQGQFINFVDGKGEKNGKAEVKRDAVVGVTQAPSTFEVGKEIDEIEEENGFEIDPVTLVIVIVSILLVLAIVFVVILRNAMNKKTEKKEDTDEEITTKIK